MKPIYTQIYHELCDMYFLTPSHLVNILRNQIWDSAWHAIIHIAESL